MKPDGDAALVSIVTPTLDRADLLQQTIRSVYGQTHRPIEHLVIDGSSTDGTIDMLHDLDTQLASPGYTLRWISEPDRGMYDAINKGLRMASGDIVAYLNSDDRYFRWSVEAAVEALRAEPDAGLVFGDVMRVDDLRDILVPVFQPPLHPRRMAAYGTLFQPTVFMRRLVFERLNGFDGGLRYVADLDFWLRAAEEFHCVQLAEFLALERRHAGMLSETASHEMSLEDRRIRASHRLGLWATSIAPTIGRVEWHLWSGLRWFSFVRATRGAGTGWKRTIDAFSPHVRPAVAIAGLLPSRGSRYRADLRWRVDPEEPGATP
jgi:glycosyltransferase involved in cell wall biosynthesis